MNTNTNIFEYASRHKFRYPYKGMITTEDLWDLAPAQLDVIFKALNKDVKVVQEESLLDKVANADKEALMKIEIVKHIFNVKAAEAAAQKDAVAKAAKKQLILGVLARKRETAIENMSEDELQKMLAELE